MPRSLLLRGLCAASIVVALAAVPAGRHTVAATTVGPKAYYLALGDSLAFGYQPNGDYAHGYADKFYAYLQPRGTSHLINMACPRETTVTFMAGGCPNLALVKEPYAPSTSQLGAALAFITAHPGQVSPVTIDIGGADLRSQIGISSAPNCTTTAQLDAVAQAALTNTASIVSQLRTALNGTGDLLVLTYYDAYQNLCPNLAALLPLWNVGLATVAQQNGALVAPVYSAFGGATAPNPNLCAYTWMCSQPRDAVATTAGYAVMAAAVAAAAAYPAPTPTNTPVTLPPSSTPVPLTNTPVPPTNTPVPPTNTPVPPSSTPTTPANSLTAPSATPTNTTVPLAAFAPPTNTTVPLAAFAPPTAITPAGPPTAAVPKSGAACTVPPAGPALTVGIAPHGGLAADISLPLALRGKLPYVTGGGTLPLTIRTAPHGSVEASLDVVTTQIVTRGKGRHRTRTMRRIVLYHTTLRGIADSLGRFSPRMPVAFQPSTAIVATLTVRARTACSAATRSTALTILPLRITVTPARLRSGGTLTIALHTGAHGQVRITLEVDAIRETVTGTGRHRHRVRHPVALYRVQLQGRADTRGQFSRRVRITYRPGMPMRAGLTVTVRLREGTAMGGATAMILPILPRR